MSRQSLRKVKLTSKFEEFSSSRLSKVISPKVEPGTRKSDKNSNQTQVAQATPVSSAPPSQVPSAPSTPLPQPTPTRHPKREVHQQQQSITPAVTPDVAKTPNYMPLKLTANGKIRGRPRKCWQKAETVVKPMSSTREELLRLREESISLKQQIEQLTTEYEDLKRQTSYTGQTVPKIDYDDLKEKYQRDIAHAKRHEWCVACLSPSRYYCCWNTTYCSQKCQVSDWYQRHMKSCERLKSLKKVS